MGKFSESIRLLTAATALTFLLYNGQTIARYLMGQYNINITTDPIGYEVIPVIPVVSPEPTIVVPQNIAHVVEDYVVGIAEVQKMATWNTGRKEGYSITDGEITYSIDHGDESLQSYSSMYRLNMNGPVTVLPSDYGYWGYAVSPEDFSHDIGCLTGVNQESTTRLTVGDENYEICWLKLAETKVFEPGQQVFFWAPQLIYKSTEGTD